MKQNSTARFGAGTDHRITSHRTIDAEAQMVGGEEYVEKAMAAAKGKLSCVVIICIIFFLVILIWGLLSNSLAILTDAIDLLSDIGGFITNIAAINNMQ